MTSRRAYLLLFLLMVGITLFLARQQPFWMQSIRNFAFDTFQRLDAPAYDPGSPCTPPQP